MLSSSSLDVNGSEDDQDGSGRDQLGEVVNLGGDSVEDGAMQVVDLVEVCSSVFSPRNATNVACVHSLRIPDRMRTVAKVAESRVLLLGQISGNCSPLATQPRTLGSISERFPALLKM